MAYLNEKEDVIQIKLTQYGKYLLSKGRFKPTFYAFFDDNVIYDTEYAGFVETQNDAETRIRQLPQPNVQHAYAGIETNIKRINELVRSGKVKLGAESIQPTAERHYALSAPLGNSSLQSDKVPAWAIQFLKNDINGAIHYVTGAHPTFRIPQLSSSIEFETYVGKEDIFQDKNVQGINDREYDDGTYIKVKEDYVLIEFEEQNAPFMNENFDVEVFMVETVEDKKIPDRYREELIPLSFVKKSTDIRTSLQGEEELQENFPELDSSYVEYFFDVFLDREIDSELLKKLKSQDKAKNIYSDKDRYDEIEEVQEGEFDIPLDDDFEECEG